MAKNISFEDMRAMGDSKVPPEIREYANKLKEQAETEKARSTIVAYIQQSNADAKKKKVLIDTLSKMVSKEKK